MLMVKPMYPVFSVGLVSDYHKSQATFIFRRMQFSFSVGIECDKQTWAGQPSSVTRLA